MSTKNCPKSHNFPFPPIQNSNCATHPTCATDGIARLVFSFVPLAPLLDLQWCLTQISLPPHPWKVAILGFPCNSKGHSIGGENAKIFLQSVQINLKFSRLVLVLMTPEEAYHRVNFQPIIPNLIASSQRQNSKPSANCKSRQVLPSVRPWDCDASSAKAAT